MLSLCGVAEKEKSTTANCGSYFFNIGRSAKNVYRNEFARVLRTGNAEFKRYNVYYISITSECNLGEYATQIKNEPGVDVIFINPNYDFDRYVALLCAN